MSGEATTRARQREGRPSTRAGASVWRVYSSFTPSYRGGSGPPLICLHGFMETWRSWELVLPALERRHTVIALTLAGHAGGPPLEREHHSGALADAVERAMSAAGFESADIVGNSLGGYLAFQLAARGRARSVVALAPAGGWAEGDESYKDVLTMQREMHSVLKMVAPQADAIMASRFGRRRATQLITTNYEHIPPELLVHQMLGVASCRAVEPIVEQALREGRPLEAEKITCPVRIVWGTEDQLLPWPRAALRYRDEWFAQADWVVLDGVGHAPQLDVPLETAQLILGFIGMFT